MKRSIAWVVTTALGLGVIVTPAAAQDQLVITADGASGNVAGTGSRENQDGGTIVFGDITSDGETTIITAAVPVAPAPPEPAPAPAPAPESEPEPAPAPAPAEGGDGAGSDRAVATETDRDADNYPDASEAGAGLDPANPDTDADGMADGDEVNIYGTEPTVFDTDGDGLGDGEEEFATGNRSDQPNDGGATRGPAAGPGPAGRPRRPTSATSRDLLDYDDGSCAQNDYECGAAAEASASTSSARSGRGRESPANH
jgi:hypothetical protein